MAKINGTSGVDTLTGTASNDTIDGLAGVDTMIGGLGHDVYYIDDEDDEIIEFAGEGTDKIYSSVDYVMPDHVEHYVMTGSADINVLGNDEDNTIYGNRGDNIIIGGQGVDAMFGGKGDDTYFINVWNLSGINDKDSGTDYIVDTGGYDTVVMGGVTGVPLKYIMQKGLEEGRFVFTDGVDEAENVTITGNSSKNYIVTGDGDDTLDGGKGADTLEGGDGKNTYIIDHKNDLIIDTIDDTGDDDMVDTAEVYKSHVMDAAADVEIVTLMGTKNIKFTGSDIANTITGNVGKNVIHGGLGDDVIDGGGGKDKLYGDGGADTFKFDVDTAYLAPVTIMDFNIGQGDKLDISDIISGYDDNITITSWLRITDKGSHTLVEVDADGSAGNASQFKAIAILHGINGLTGETALLQAGTIIAETI